MDPAEHCLEPGDATLAVNLQNFISYMLSIKSNTFDFRPLFVDIPWNFYIYICM